MPSLGGLVRCSLSAWPVRAGPVKRRTDLLCQCRRQQIRHASTSNLNSKAPATYHLHKKDATDIATKVRESMRLVGQPLAIVTTPVETDIGFSTSQPLHGLVASSFNIVSMAAPGGPIVSFNLKLPSRTFSAISASGHFEVSFPYSADVCRLFLGMDIRQSGKSRPNQSQGGDKPANTKGLPRYNRQQPAFESQTEHLLRVQRTFAYRCEWLQEQSVTVADHIIMVGQVKEFVVGDAIDERSVPVDKLPINYRDSKFLRLKTSSSSHGFFHFSIKEEML